MTYRHPMFGITGLAIAVALVVGLWAGSWGTAEAQTLPPTTVLDAPVVIGEETPCSFFDMSATGFWNVCPDFRIVHDGGGSYHGMFYNNGGVDHFDPVLTFLRSQGTSDAPAQVQTGERVTPIAAYYYVGPTHKYQQVGALTWRNGGIGDCRGCLWGSLEVYLADFTDGDPSTNDYYQRALDIRGRAGSRWRSWRRRGLSQRGAVRTSRRTSYDRA